MYTYICRNTMVLVDIREYLSEIISLLPPGRLLN